MLIHYAVGKLCWERVTISVGPVYRCIVLLIYRGLEEEFWNVAGPVTVPDTARVGARCD